MLRQEPTTTIGNVTRTVRKAAFATLAAGVLFSAGTAFASTTDYMSYTYGVQGAPGSWSIQGYSQAGSMGSLSPNTTSDGKTIIAYWDYTTLFFDGMNWSGTSSIQLGVSGNPGASWLVSITTPDGATLYGGAATYACGGSQCFWTWPNTWQDFTPSPRTIAITHQ